MIGLSKYWSHVNKNFQRSCVALLALQVEEVFLNNGLEEVGEHIEQLCVSSSEFIVIISLNMY